MLCATPLHTHAQMSGAVDLILDKAGGIVTFPFKLLQICYSTKPQVSHITEDQGERRTVDSSH